MKLDFSALSPPLTNNSGTGGTEGTSTQAMGLGRPPVEHTERDRTEQPQGCSPEPIPSVGEVSRMSPRHPITTEHCNQLLTQDVPLDPFVPFEEPELSEEEKYFQYLEKFSPYEARLAIEAEKRDDFCRIHRQLLGGLCRHYSVTKGVEQGDRVTALNCCLLWKLINAGTKIELIAEAEIFGSITVGDVLRWVSINNDDLERLCNDRRLLLTCAESLQGAGHFWET